MYMYSRVTPGAQVSRVGFDSWALWSLIETGGQLARSDNLFDSLF